MNEFRIFAHGEAFDVDAYLAATPLRPDYVWRRGDQRRHACVESRHPTSGVEYVLGNGRAIPLPEQQTIALDYLAANKEALRALAQWPGVTTFILGLQYQVELDDSIVGLSMGPSAWLMWHALDIGIRPTFYVTFDRPIEGDGEAGEGPS